MPRKNKKQFFENLEVVDAGAKGKGIAKAPDGRIVFLPYAVPGDVVDVTTFKKRKAYFEGTVDRVNKPSDKRTTPVCEHFGVCGGCKWQNMAYEHQLFYKQKEIENNLLRIGKVTLPERMPIQPSAEQYFYRNKMEFSFSNSRWLTKKEIENDKDIADKNALGFHIPGMWDKILDIKKCHLQQDPSNAIRLAIKEFAVAHKLTFFDPKVQSGLLRTVMIRTSSTDEIMIVIQFYDDNKEQRELLLDHLIVTFPEINSLQYIINQKPNDTIYDQEIICYHGKDHIFEEMEGLKFKINAKSFYQTNSKQAYELYKIVRSFADLTGKELVYDLYTGTGTIALFLSKYAKKVIGVEAVPEAIEDAKANERFNNINNTHFYVGDMKKVFNNQFTQTNGLPDVIVTDPPRDGMHKDVVEQLINIGAKKIVYVSCNSATQARDLSLMQKHYKVTKVQPIDMFPQTHHVENVVLLEQINI